MRSRVKNDLKPYQILNPHTLDFLRYYLGARFDKISWLDVSKTIVKLVSKLIDYEDEEIKKIPTSVKLCIKSLYEIFKEV